jgi:galactosamine-6-phosphate isomerase
MESSPVFPGKDPQAMAGQPGAGFQLRIAGNFEEMSRLAAGQIEEELRAKPGLLLCAATGSTPTRAYQILASKKKEQPALFRALRIVKLDEWGGLPMENAGTCETYLRTHLLVPLEVPPARYISFQNGPAPESECARITACLEAEGPIDLCILGLGLNGHLGFNEPADTLQSGPHCAELSRSSLQHSMIRDEKIAVTFGLTLGMAHLLQSRKILLLVNGSHKAAAMRQLLSKVISTRFPASFLWLHPHVTCFCDRDALGG